jgi:hypothetical protein
MKFETKYDVNEILWHMRDGKIIPMKITDIQIHFDPDSKYEKLSILYGTDDYCAIYESQEGKTWWKTREQLVNYILNPPS